MKFLAAGLLLLLLLLQYRLWLGEGGMREVYRLRAEIGAQQKENGQLRERNRTLAAEVQDLKKGTTAIEERARTDLGMVGKSETFFQVISDPSAALEQGGLEQACHPGSCKAVEDGSAEGSMPSAPAGSGQAPAPPSPLGARARAHQPADRTSPSRPAQPELPHTPAASWQGGQAR